MATVFFDALDVEVTNLLEDAARWAEANDRRTVQPCDLGTERSDSSLGPTQLSFNGSGYGRDFGRGGNAALPSRTNELKRVARELGWEPTTTGLDGTTVDEIYIRWRDRVETVADSASVPATDGGRLVVYCEDDVQALATTYDALADAARHPPEDDHSDRWRVHTGNDRDITGLPPMTLDTEVMWMSLPEESSPRRLTGSTPRCCSRPSERVKTRGCPPRRTAIAARADIETYEII